ncbi:peptidoglycan-binding protein [Streptomyces rubellomurinus]|uniref:peptidoglycan-binding protein n=1 Tax=Streptomyces rubellomurinus (strain ATCC 31215) TaxID=359131 RepID=UPI000A781846|nr:peptidoglycan-binding protein [Streptomyces rubellomurinus]
MRDEFVALLTSEEGYHEGRDSGGSWNNVQKFSPAVPGLEWSQGQAWCATFTAWGATQTEGMAERWPLTASCATAVDWWQQQGRWTEYPVLGGPFYLGSHGQDHVGVVVAYDQDTIWTIEGNTNSGGSPQGDGVYARQRPRQGPGSPYGYGVPDYPEGTVSADPALGGVPSARVGTPSASVEPAPAPAPDPTPARYQTTINGLAYGYGAQGPQVTAVGEALVSHGFGSYYQVGPGPDWTDADTGNYADYQRSLGYGGADADGVPGEASLRELIGYLPGGAPAFPGRECFGPGQNNDYVRQLGEQLVAKGYGGAYRIGPGPQWSEADRRAVQAFQQAQGWTGADADGYPGPETWRRLFA